MPAQLRNGVIGAPGGRRPNAGRKPDWFKRKLRALASSKEALKFLEDAIKGKKIDVRVDKDGDVISVSPTVSARAEVWEKVHDRGYGKPVSLLEMQDGEGNAVMPAVVMLPPQRKK